MMQLKNILQRLASGIDMAGVVGIGLAVFAAAVWFSAVLPAGRQLAQLQAQPLQGAGGGARSDGVRTAALRGAEQLEQFNRKFPAPGDAPELVRKLHDIAAQNSIALDTGEYQMARDRDAGVTRYQITLPLRGTYWQVRLFVAQVLDEIPASALDEISMKRESVSARAVETRVRFTLFLGEKL